MSEGSKYLELAERIISVRGIPLSGSQIIEFAQEYDALPFDSYQTIVKTLQARISEDIAGRRNKSRFIRIGIGKYFLKRLSKDRSGYGSRDWVQSRGPRKKPEHPHRILTVPIDSISGDYSSIGWNDATRILEKGQYDYQSEIQPGFLPVITCAALYWKHSYFSFQIGIHTHFESLSGCQSIWLRKYLDEFDLDLFETDGTGATSSTVRSALPAIAEGRRSRLENGRLSQKEALKFYQVSSLLIGKGAMKSIKTNSLTLFSTIDLTSVFNRLPTMQRRLEINSPHWVSQINLKQIVDDMDALSYISQLETSVC